MKILVLGGDGYCGWPTSLHLSDAGHEVVIVDNCVRRQIDHELKAQSLTPIADPRQRVLAWQEVSGQTVEIEFGDLLDWEFLSGVVRRHRPEAVVHFAEQRSAPSSRWKSSLRTATSSSSVRWASTAPPT
jgi:UDP-sulfoquinovose synthase